MQIVCCTQLIVCCLIRKENEDEKIIAHLKKALQNEKRNKLQKIIELKIELNLLAYCIHKKKIKSIMFTLPIY